jgi:hypothetical protein
MDYRSIFLSTDWAHQRYFGWDVVADEPGLRILEKRRSLIVRYLFLLNSNGTDRLTEWIARLSGAISCADLIIHDFDDVLRTSDTVGGLRFQRAAPRERLLNIATFAIDLNRNSDDLMTAMSADYRRKIRKAPSMGITVSIYRKPSTQMQEQFVAAFRRFASERGLSGIDGKVLSAMYLAEQGLLLIARKAGQLSSFLHIYRAGEAASFMWGVSLSKENDGAGQYLHWQAMQSLKEDGVRWYDLGGIPSTDPNDGIFNFKRKFGGQLISLGTEWRFTGPVARTAFTAMRASQRITALGSR